MHFLNVDWTWGIVIVLGIGLYTVVQGGGWKEFLDNNVRFSGWSADNGLRVFFWILFFLMVAFCIWFLVK